MKSVFYLFIAFNLLVLVSSQFFSSGFYQGGFQAAGFSPFPHGGHPFNAGGSPFGYGAGDGHTHVHYHVNPRGGGLGGALSGINSRDIGSGAVGFILGSLLNRNKK